MRYGRLRALAVPSTTAPGNVNVASARFRLCGWSLSAPLGPGVPDSASAAVAAAAAGTLTLTGFTAVSSVTVQPAAAWPAGVNQVTVTNVTGGTVTADIPGGTANPVIITWSPPVGVTGTPVVSVPAIVGGPAYTIDAAGESGGTALVAPLANGQFFDGGQVVGQPAALAGLTDTRWLGEMGVELDTSLVLFVNAGTLFGCVYVRECWPGDDDYRHGPGG